MKKAVWIFVMVVAAIVIPEVAEAQCAMCKAVAESDLDGGGKAALGLNSGILYLMAFPYLLIGTIGFFWYRHNKAQKAQG
jgi:hypothetical protein